MLEELHKISSKKIDQEFVDIVNNNFWDLVYVRPPKKESIVGEIKNNNFKKVNHGK